MIYKKRTTGISDSIRPEDSISMVNSSANFNRPAYDSNKIDLGECRHRSLDENRETSIERRERSSNSDVYHAVPTRHSRQSSYQQNSTEIGRVDYYNQHSLTKRENVVPLNDHKTTARCDSNDTLNSEVSQETVLVKPESDRTSSIGANDILESSLSRRPPAHLLLSPETEHQSTVSSRTASPVHFSDNRNSEDLRKLLEPKNQQYAQERQYRVVLAGDAAVGKSSFILQLCTGYFHNRITSTLGVDFHTKAFDIDGKLTNLQLWDTAGQERFRAMAKSYFRRADGAILLYDVTFEQSFVHVRDWVETIEAGANRKIPIIICANKCDAIPECREKGIPYVPKEDGETLASCYDATFVEVSAKEGDNVLEAVVELSRQLWIAEDEERCNGLKLTGDNSGDDDSKCCK